MAYVTDSIQFRTGAETPLSHFASVFNHVRDFILSTGMEQVSLGEWPDQIGDVVTGVSTGNDVSLDDLTLSAHYNRVGSWVFKHPTINMYIRMEVGLLVPHSYIFDAQLPRFLFTCGQDLVVGSSEFSGSTVSITPMKEWNTSGSSGNTSTRWGLGVYPADFYILRAYCGDSGFWIYADGGCNPSSSGLANPLPRLSILAAAVLVDSTGDYRVALDATNQNSSTGTGVASLGSAPAGVIPCSYVSGIWRELPPGSLGVLHAPQFLSSDKGIRVAQAQIYDSGAPIPMPLAMIQATFEEVPLRFDLDGSGERTWLPVPAYQAVQFFMSVSPPANMQYHSIYALPVSDD